MSGKFVVEESASVFSVKNSDGFLAQCFTWAKAKQVADALNAVRRRDKPPAFPRWFHERFGVWRYDSEKSGEYFSFKKQAWEPAINFFFVDSEHPEIPPEEAARLIAASKPAPTRSPTEIALGEINRRLGDLEASKGKDKERIAALEEKMLEEELRRHGLVSEYPPK